MAKPTPWEDEYTLLCERCGYVLEGLAPSGNCPECGKPIAESLPERRVGTPWQQKPGVKSLLVTWWMTLRHPLKTLDVMRVGYGRLRLLGWLTIVVASFITAAGFVFPSVYIQDPLASYFDENARADPYWITLLTIPAFAIVPLVILPVLTWIETRGLIIIGRARRFRIDLSLARSITAHGCAGWLLLSILYFTLYNFGAILIQLNMPKPIEGQQDVMQYVHLFVNRAPQWVYWLDRGFWGTGVIIGFLFFETFAYLGLRRCKFANRLPRSESTHG